MSARRCWEFRGMQRSEVAADPVQGEFFTPERHADAVVREAIQNSLDAVAGDGPVRVAISFSGTKNALDAARAGPYLAGLGRHLAALPNHRGVPEGAMDFVVIEDFRTTGLVGDPGSADEVEVGDGNRNLFFYFWRNIGRSSKTERDRGVWGLGKNVFPAASRINAFFGLTSRAGDRHGLLMGQAVLKTHRIDGARFCPYGFHGEFDGPDRFPMPVMEEEVIARFRKDFGIERVAEPGLSVVVPFPDEELEPEAVLRAAILHYFYPVLSGELVVEVKCPGASWKIDASSIREVAQAVSWPEGGLEARRLEGIFDLADWAIRQRADELLKLDAPPVDRAPVWSPELVGRLDVEHLRRRFEAGERLGFVVPIIVKRRDRPAEASSFRMFIQRDERLKSGEDHYIRQGITISKISRLRDRPVRGLVVVDDPPLARLLRDSENPSHTEWQERRLREKYEHGASTVRFVSSSLSQMVARLSRPSEGRYRDLLKDFFYVEVPEQPDDGAPGNGRRRTDREPPAPPPPPPALVSLSRLDDGFRITAGRTDPLPRGIRARAAYEVRGGNPFRRYSALDFDLDQRPIRVRPRGVRVLGRHGNELELEIRREDFHVEVTGFDRNRDLRVVVEELEPQEEPQE